MQVLVSTVYTVAVFECARLKFRANAASQVPLDRYKVRFAQYAALAFGCARPRMWVCSWCQDFNAARLRCICKRKWCKYQVYLKLKHCQGVSRCCAVSYSHHAVLQHCNMHYQSVKILIIKSRKIRSCITLIPIVIQSWIALMPTRLFLCSLWLLR